MLGFDSSDSSSEYEDTDEESSSEESDGLGEATYLTSKHSVGTSFQIGQTTVNIVAGDIVHQPVDVIVNSANPNLDLTQGRASSSLLAAAGSRIQRECQQNYPRGLRPGEIAVTSGGNLRCTAIYHGVLTRYSSQRDEKLLSDLVSECLDQADTDGYHSIAFPPFGTGYLSYPTPRVADIMLECIEDFTSRTLTTVYIVIYSQESSCFQDFLNAASKCSSSAPLQSVGWSASSSHPPIASGSGGGASSVRIGAINVRVVIGALNQISADVLAHCAPKDLQLSSGALSRVLLNDAGPGLQHELSSVARNGIDYGSVVTTQGHNLKCKYVLHGSLPKWGTSSPDPLKCLEQFVSGCLETANFNSMRSIAFPTLGIGALGYPTKAAVQGMVQSIKRFAHKHQAFLTDISIVVFSGSGDCATVQYELSKELGISMGASVNQGSISHYPPPSSSSQGTSRTVAGGSINRIPVNVVVGSLSNQNVDVIVNSVGQDLAMTSGSCSAIVAAAGPNLAKELLQNNTSLPYGKVAVTKGYNLKCAEVFHGALLSWYSKGAGSTNQPDIVLEEFVYKCLEKAMSKGHKTIAFPALGAGNLKFPLNVAAACMVAGIVKFSKKYSIAEVRIVLYGGSPDLRQLEKEYKDEISHPGRKVNPVGHPVPHKQSHQYAEPLRGSQDWFSWKYREELRTPKYWTKYTYRNTLKDWNLDVRTHFHSLQPVDQVVSNSIAAALKSTMGMKTIKSIQRVENVDLFQKYAEECQRLFRKAYVEGNFVPLDKIKSSQGPVKVMKRLDPSMTQHTYPEINEYYFFHGTNAQHVDAICSQGLDSRLANSGRLGSGVYGAEVASKSAGYVGPNSKGECPMFLIRMCLGDVYLTGQGGAFKRPPNKTNSSKGGGTQQDLYDSVVANGGSFSDREFVVYDRNQAYPEYLIWYK